ncbi:transposase [Streptomyces ferrugineus]|uniref:Transposase n=1 Tax=Streptomyces ferrugineus TaxID=1413221 RepID=A0A7M2SX02_9ACTN|nr:transposase [Streptomyces ferrugineus]
MTDAEWHLIESLLPVPACQKSTGGHPEKWPRREIVGGIRYLVDNGIKWQVIENRDRGVTFLGDCMAGEVRDVPGPARDVADRSGRLSDRGRMRP